MAGIIGANNQFGKDFGHPGAGLQGTILAVYEVRPGPSPQVWKIQSD